MARRGRSFPTETMVKVYGDSGSDAKDARKLGKQGWVVANTTHRQPRAGIGRIVTLGMLTAIRPPKPELVVTYQRTRAVDASVHTARLAAPAASPIPIGEYAPSKGGSPLRTVVIIGVILIVILLVLA